MSGPAGSRFLGIERSVSGRSWRARLTDERSALELSQRLDLPEIVGRVLAARGVGLDEAEDFLNPTLRAALPDPSHLLDMDKAAERLAHAIMGQESIAVFGDYDVDGATSSALLKRFFEAVGGAVRVYIPDRLKEGYGPNAPALLKLQAEGANIVVTVDCGTTAFEPLAAAGEAGLEVIVVDHHICEARLPRSFALINPNRMDGKSACGHVAAVGVAFLLVVAVNRELRRAGWFDGREEPDLKQWLDLVALGTVCDAVPLVGVNRAFVAQGLKVMAGRRNIGLAALADVARLNEPPGAFHAGFVLGPRINAGGRVGQSDLGVRLLTTADRDEAWALAERLDALNNERRVIEAEVLAQAIDQADEQQAAAPGAPLILVARGGWHPGVIGIVASRLSERYNRPTAVVALDKGVGKASARSIPGVDLGAAITASRQAGLLINGGGHPMAAGFTVSEERLEELGAFLEKRLNAQVEAAGTERTLALDGALVVGAATLDLVATLERVGPFGNGNSEPRFVLTHARIVRSDVVGEKHVRCILAGREGGRVKGIAFRSVASPVGRALLDGAGAEFHVAGHLRPDNWRGKESVQFFIDDLAAA